LLLHGLALQRGADPFAVLRREPVLVMEEMIELNEE
jgi:hypothetical protein